MLDFSSSVIFIILTSLVAILTLWIESHDSWIPSHLPFFTPPLKPGHRRLPPPPLHTYPRPSNPPPPPNKKRKYKTILAGRPASSPPLPFRDLYSLAAPQKKVSIIPPPTSSFHEPASIWSPGLRDFKTIYSLLLVPRVFWWKTYIDGVDGFWERVRIVNLDVA